jgi:hypothetical protein
LRLQARNRNQDINLLLKRVLTRLLSDNPNLQARITDARS